MTALDKLNQLYEVKLQLKPYIQEHLVKFVEVQNRKLSATDIKFVNDIYPDYFKKNGRPK